MKTLTALFLMATAATAPRVITAPEFESGPWTFRIAAVTLSDTATQIDADIYQRPEPDHWVQIDDQFRLESRITDNTYPVRQIKGLPLNQQVFTGDSAHLRASFIFDPLQPVDSVFDFIEVNGTWDVRGIDLNYRPQGITTHIEGTLKGRPSASWLLLHPSDTDMRVTKCIIVPVQNGRFEYDLVTTDTLCYELMPGIDILRGGGPYARFFTEGQDINIHIPADGSAFLHTTEGGPLTRRIVALYNKQNEVYQSEAMEEYNRLMEEKLFYTPEVENLSKRIDLLDFNDPQRDSLFQVLLPLVQSEKGLSAAGKKAQAALDSLMGAAEEIKYDFIASDSTIAGLSMLKSTFFNYHVTDKDRLLSLYRDVYASRYPDHPYSIALQQHLSEEKAEVGSRYPDFTAPDLQGNLHRLSDLIKGKYAVIDLWASWCGPCRRHSKELIPIYEQWKDKGFTVVGIARENGDTQAMERAIEKDGYPWLNLVELNDARQIWARYLANNGGGKILFVSPSGEILMIDPEISAIASRLPTLLQ